MYVIKILLACVLFFNILTEYPKDRDLFIPPMRIPLALSANFGELRADHFHSGLDIKTQGLTGMEVVAAASGYVYRISISPGGFGKALYIRHPSGYSTVYGHLDKFIPEIEEYVISRQYEEKSFMVSLWPQKDKFRFEQGDIIAYSGNSGSSSGPHLHYEIRKSDQEIPLNPLLFEFGIRDDIKPVIEKLVIFPTGKNTQINGRTGMLKFSAAGGNGNYYIPNTVNISGPAGFGIKSFDQFCDSYNKCSAFSIELKIDSLTHYKYVMDEFSFNESRYVNSHIDYETYVKENIYLERAFVLPNDRLSVYQKVVNNGIFNFNDNRKHSVEIILTDLHNNKSILSFQVASVAPEIKEGFNNKEPDCTLMPYGRNNKFVSKDIMINIPSGTLYDTLHFAYKRTKGNTAMYSDVFQIHNRYTPLHRSYELSIRPERIPAGKESKMLIVQASDGITAGNPLGSRWENGCLIANPNSFGNFFVGIDTLPPMISTNGYKQGADLSGKSELRIRISDNFSGIRKYEPLIDNKWALFEYDQKNNMLIYRFDPVRITKGSRHLLSLAVTDNRDNVSTLNWEFTW